MRYKARLLLRLFILVILLSFPFSIGNASEIIKGHACYHYSDNESINVARDIALSMAKRDALESYSVFVQSTSSVENSVLRNDLIASLTVGVMRNLRIINKEEDIESKQVCRTIQAEIEPLAIKREIEAKIKIYKQKKANFPTGLPESEYIKVLKTGYSGYQRLDGSIDGSFIVTTLCKQTSSSMVIITWYDKDGIPDYTEQELKNCEYKGQVLKHSLPLPPYNMTYDYRIE